ncbi:hypothetical protein D9Q98_002142 [Chlorella vulgaris]|uniref:Vacuolar protein 8 n=1 Tax=Chlorella vulgaris TaxID=3077 RepID=A0A9D4TVW4_CHLVU|nr:hypothetical protein D9Q98_002142 [Chlorella vulgaris]
MIPGHVGTIVEQVLDCQYIRRHGGQGAAQQAAHDTAGSEPVHLQTDLTFATHGASSPRSVLPPLGSRESAATATAAAAAAEKQAGPAQADVHIPAHSEPPAQAPKATAKEAGPSKQQATNNEPAPAGASPTRTSTQPGQAEAAPVSGNTVLGLLQQLKSGTAQHKQDTARTLFNLLYGDKVKAPIVSAGAFAPLVKLLNDGTATAQTHAAVALACLVKGHTYNRTAAGAVPGVFAALKELLGSSDVKVQGTAAWALGRLVLNHADNKTAAGAVPGVFVALKELLGSSDVAVQEDAARAPAFLQREAAWALACLVGSHAENQTAAGAVPGVFAALMELLGSSGVAAQGTAAWALGRLVGSHAENKTAAGAVPGVFAALKELLGSSDVAVQREAALTIGDLVKGHADNQVAAGAVPGLCVQANLVDGNTATQAAAIAEGGAIAHENQPSASRHPATNTDDVLRRSTRKNKSTKSLAEDSDIESMAVDSDGEDSRCDSRDAASVLQAEYACQRPLRVVRLGAVQVSNECQRMENLAGQQKTLREAVMGAMPRDQVVLREEVCRRLKSRWNYRATMTKKEHYPSGPRQGTVYYVKAMPMEEANTLVATWVPWALQQIRERTQQQIDDLRAVVEAAEAQLAGMHIDDEIAAGVDAEPELIDEPINDTA